MNFAFLAPIRLTSLMGALSRTLLKLITFLKTRCHTSVKEFGTVARRKLSAYLRTQGQ